MCGKGSTCSRGLESIHHELDIRAREYFRAQPGRDSVSSNVSLHGALEQFYRGNLQDKEMIQNLLDNVIYRLNLTHDTDEYLNAMGIEFPSCLGYSIEKEYKPNEIKNDKNDMAFDYLAEVGLFDEALPQLLRNS